jgi:hypothetical protein
MARQPNPHFKLAVLVYYLGMVDAYYSCGQSTFDFMKIVHYDANRMSSVSRSRRMCAKLCDKDWEKTSGLVSRSSMLMAQSLSFAATIVAARANAAEVEVVDRSQEAAESIGKKVRELGAQLPGLGPSDVTYPAWFAGRWHATRTLASIELLPLAKAIPTAVADLPPTGQTLTYDVRFLPDGRGGTIADRGFAAENRARAEGRAGARAVWSPRNPNALALTWPDGAAAELRVTKRRAAPGDAALGPDWSELTRIAEVPPPGGAGPAQPSVRAEWVRADARSPCCGLARTPPPLGPAVQAACASESAREGRGGDGGDTHRRDGGRGGGPARSGACEGGSRPRGGGSGARAWCRPTCRRTSPAPGGSRARCRRGLTRRERERKTEGGREGGREEERKRERHQ